MELVKSLSFPFSKKGGLIFNILYQKDVIRANGKGKKLKNDPLVKSLNLGEFLIFSLWIKGKPTGIVVVDNYITKKSINDDDMRIFTMFMEQAQGALENSQSF